MYCPVSLHCCTELHNHMYHGIQQGGSEVRISSWTGFNHGQISIETATHSYWLQNNLGLTRFPHFDLVIKVGITVCATMVVTLHSHISAYGAPIDTKYIKSISFVISS